MSEEQPQVASSYGAVDLSGRGNAAEPSNDNAFLDLTEANFEQVVRQSAQVPVVVYVTTAQAEDVTHLGDDLKVVVEQHFAGRILLVKCDGEKSASIVAALQVQGVPTVIGVLGGRPIPLFVGPQEQPQIKAVFDELLQVAASMGVVGTVSSDNSAGSAPEPELHVQARESEAKGDWDTAIAKWALAVEENPSDKVAKHALANAKLQQRQAHSQGHDEDPTSLADSFAAVGNYQAAFQILLKQIAQTSGQERDTFRKQLLDLFEVAGDDPAVGPARSQLASLLF